MKSLKILIIILSICLVSFFRKELGLSSYNLDHYSKNDSKNISQIYSKSEWAKFLAGVNELSTLWFSGDYPYLEEMNCSRFHWPSLEKQVSEQYLKCNPVVFNCFLDELSKTHDSQFKFDFDEKDEFLKLSSELESNGDSDDINLYVESLNGLRRKISLSKNCNETLLEKGEKVYSPLNYELNLEQSQRESSKLWSLEKNIFIDKFHVSSLSLYGSLESKHRKIFDKDSHKLFRPVTSFLLDEMKSFCLAKGKKLLTAKLYDAMVLERRDFKSLLKRDEEVTCKDFYHRGCVESGQPVLYWSTDNVSNIGSYDLRGGVIEIVDNQEHPFFNAVASSMYFSKKSYWHNLSHRFHWDGKGFKSKNFKFYSSITGERLGGISSDNIKLGFRCYREI